VKEEELRPLIGKILPHLMAAMSSSDMEVVAKIVAEELTSQGVGFDIELTLHFGGRVKANIRPVTDVKVLATQDYEGGEACRFTLLRKPIQSSPKTRVFDRNFG
jgi:hypothetical protein